MDKALLDIINRRLKNKEWAEKNKNTASTFQYVKDGKTAEEQVQRLAGVLTAAQIMMVEDEGILFRMINRIACARGVDLLGSMAELRDFRATKDRTH